MHTVQLKRWTRDGYGKMIEAGIFAPGERVELIDGEIIAMSPQNSGHSTAVSLSADRARWQLRVPEFFRANAEGGRRLFTERRESQCRSPLPLMECLCVIGLALSGAAGAPEAGRERTDADARLSAQRQAQHHELAATIELAQDFCAIARKGHAD